MKHDVAYVTRAQAERNSRRFAVASLVALALCAGLHAGSAHAALTVASAKGKLAAGNSHSLQVQTNGTVLAWGDNSAAQLGDGTATNRSAPVSVILMILAEGKATAGGSGGAVKVAGDAGAAANAGETIAKSRASAGTIFDL